MSSNRRVRQILNLFYYNLFRFETYTQELVARPFYGAVNSVGLGRIIEKRSGRENWDDYVIGAMNDPKGGISMIFTGRHIAILLMLLFMTFLNVTGTVLEFYGESFWFYGMVVCCILAVLTSYYVGPTNPKKYLADFKKFEAWPVDKKRKAAGVTFLIVLGIWAGFVFSLILYLTSSLD